MKKIIVIGGTGLLGKSLKKQRKDLICYDSKFDIFDFIKLEQELDKQKPDIIINAAAIKSEKVLNDIEKSININVIGSSNISKYCIKNDIKLVYISTDYIYEGVSGNYKEIDTILPENLYAWTKLGGECSTKLVKNHLIIRTSFGDDKFPYESAFDNLYTSKDYVDVISKKILDIIETDYVGVLNIGTERKSILEFASLKNVVNSKSLFSKKDFSMNLDLYEKVLQEMKYKDSYKSNTICPITKRMDKIKYFDLGNIPLVNNLFDTFDESINCEKYPLSVSIFNESQLSVLDIIVKPDKLFLNYLYRSDTNKPYYTHCENMYSYILNYIELKESDLCVDIGGNDGTLLLAFNEKSKKLNVPICEKINIEPSNISLVSSNRGIKTINNYFTKDIFNVINKKAKLIVSTNVFQHLHDIQDFVNGVNELIDENGIWCLEFPYWANSMETNQFDQVYHEHIYYYLVTPLFRFLKLNNLKIVNISEYFIHGGSLRLIITKETSNIKSDNTLDYFLVKEKKYNIEYYKNWSKNVDNHLIKCKNLLKNLKGNIVGFGAAAKGCIFLNTLNIDYKTIKYVIDDTLLKQGKYIPGTGIKIVSREILKTENIDYIFILAHNFSEYIIQSLRDSGYNGKFILMLPEIKII